MKYQQGFTVLEAVIAIALVSFVGLIVVSEQSALNSIHRDQERKASVNKIHATLEEIVKPAVKGYPRILSRESLRDAVETTELSDPRGNKINTPLSDYRYQPTGCDGGDICTGYTLSATLERERDFVRTDG
tara:strand:- start:128 stop:520 length:393 start_codon:yes stop_codon:yes gene_type:complete